MVGFQCLLFFFHYKISKMVGFTGLQDLSDGRFWWVMRSQRRAVLLGYEISVMAGFSGLQDLSDGRF